MKKAIFTFLILSILSGCASVATSNLTKTRQSFANDNFVESAETFSDGEDITNQDNLEL